MSDPGYGSDQFFAVADFIVENDPAVNSYLNTGVIDEAKSVLIIRESHAPEPVAD